MKLFAFLKVTKFQFIVILSENLSVGFERKKHLVTRFLCTFNTALCLPGDFQFPNDAYFLVSKLIWQKHQWNIKQILAAKVLIYFVTIAVVIFIGFTLQPYI